ncbi:MAG: hypothetical protein AAGL11_11030 [Pseudomonadota bacterium]
MPTALLLPVVLRLAGPIAFVTAALAAGALNRSFMLVPLLAVGASLTTVLIRKVAPSPVSDLQGLLNPDAPPPQPSPFRGMGRRLGLGLIGYALAFGLAALIAALFQSTEFEPRLMASDAGYVLIPALIALLGAWGSARLGLSQIAGMMGQMQDMFAQMQAAQGQDGAEDPFTVDGEVIDPDEDRPSS